MTTCCSRYKLSQHCRVQRQKTARLFSEDHFGCSLCLCAVVEGVQHLNMYKLMLFQQYFIFTVAHYSGYNRLCIREDASLLPYLSSTTVCPLLLVSSMMIFSSSGKSICTSFLLEPDETGTSVKRINSSALTSTSQVTEILLLYSRSKPQESVNGMGFFTHTEDKKKKKSK